MQAAAAFLRRLNRLEQLTCFIAFAVMAGALIFDVLKREITGSGAFGAPQVGVMGMIVVSYIGIALASASGSHYRPRFADRLIPRRFDALANRLTDFGFAAFCGFMSYVALRVALESFELADINPVLRTPVWPVQGVLVLGFGLVALRHLLYGLFPALSPQPAAAAEVAGEQQVQEILHGHDAYDAEQDARKRAEGGPAVTAAAQFGLPFVLLALLAARQNIVVLLGVATVWAYVFFGDGEIMNVVYDIWEASNREVLLSVPLYILAGAIMSQGSIAERLINLMHALMRPIPGGLALAALLSCSIFAAISGSSVVTLLAVGGIMYPALLKAGYPRAFSIGMLCAGGTLGIIIPPSIPLILYGIMTQASITDLFIAGVGPGLLLIAAFAAYALAFNWKRDREGWWSLREIAVALKDSVWALLTPVVILGGIYSGYFTPTESAAVAVLTAILVELLAHHHGLAHLLRGRWGRLNETLADMGRLTWRVAGETSTMMGALFPILAVALSLNVFMTYEQVPATLVQWLTAYIDSPMMFVLLTNLFLLLVGCFLDSGSAILILSPLLPPMAQSFGMDLVHFGIMMNVNLEIGYLTPPMGLNLIVAMGAFREEFLTICRGVLPFIAIMVACLMVIAFWPDLTLFLIR